MAFPLPFVPALSYKTSGRRFGATRPKGRLHAGCDLIATPGIAIRAIEDGVVIQGPKLFYENTYSLVVRHKSGIVARYCEIRGAAKEVRLGSEVKEGQIIAYVGQLPSKSSMLHFEVYSGKQHGSLTVRTNGPYQRRADLMNPASLLDKLALDDLTLQKGKA
jgi:murein DD-endopeptidase MepM/ murein hydrolase activator NlpD